jgi:hypothetical protein
MNIDEYHYYSLLKMLRQQKFMVFLFSNLEFTLNSMLVIDLFISMRNPFYPRKMRMKEIYLMLTLTNVFLLFLYPISYTIEDVLPGNSVLDARINFNYSLNNSAATIIIMLAIMIIFSITAHATIIVGMSLFKAEGSQGAGSNSLRKEFLIRHLAKVTLNTIRYVPIVFSAYMLVVDNVF